MLSFSEGLGTKYQHLAREQSLTEHNDAGRSANHSCQIGIAAQIVIL